MRKVGRRGAPSRKINSTCLHQIDTSKLFSFRTKRRGEKREKNFEPNREIQSWVSAHTERHPWKRCATKGVTRSNVVHPDGINPPKYQRKPFQKKTKQEKKREISTDEQVIYIHPPAAACEKRERIRVDYRRHCEALHG